jgi:hypothetical protein
MTVWIRQRLVVIWPLTHACEFLWRNRACLFSRETCDNAQLGMVVGTKYVGWIPFGVLDVLGRIRWRDGVLAHKARSLSCGSTLRLHASFAWASRSSPRESMRQNACQRSDRHVMTPASTKSSEPILSILPLQERNVQRFRLRVNSSDQHR